MNLRPRRRESPDINLTPLIDVVFLLLIFFMVSTTFKEGTRIQIQLPQAEGQAQAQDSPEPLTLLIDAQGNFYLGDRRVVDRSRKTLQKALAGAIAGHRDRWLILKADARTPHQAVMTALDAASQLGLVRISFAAAHPDPQP